SERREVKEERRLREETREGRQDRRPSLPRPSTGIAHTCRNTCHGYFQSTLKVRTDRIAASIAFQQLSLQIVQWIRVGLAHIKRVTQQGFITEQFRLLLDAIHQDFQRYLIYKMLLTQCVYFARQQ